MNMMARVAARGELWRQSKIACDLGSHFVGAVLDAGERQLYRAPRTAALIAGWPDDRSAAALAMRFNAALHAIARRGEPPILAALYRREHGDFDAAVGAALDLCDAFVEEWMRDPPQTNEVARSAALAAALMVVRQETGLPAELFELGSSCGLNLNLTRYAFDLGGVCAGDPQSPVRVAPVWRGPAPRPAPIALVAARGVDLRPLDPANEANRERLLSHIWADQTARLRRLEKALDLACVHRPRVDRADAVQWLPQRLEEPARAGVCRVVFHSMVLQYLEPADRTKIVAALHAAGAQANEHHPLAWIGLEWTPTREEVQLSLTLWPTGDRRVLAVCHPYGEWIDWRHRS